MDPEKLAALSDEEFLRHFESMQSEAEKQTEQAPAQEETQAPVVEEQAPVQETPPAQEEQQPVVEEEIKQPDLFDSLVQKEETKPETEVKEETQTQETKPATTVTAPSADHKAFYDAVVAVPLKVRGKTIEIKTPEEARRLIEMGADYTYKTQALAPDRKILAMLEKHQLKDEAKLAFLIDLSNKNPEAIQKLVKESGIDPLDIDTAAPVNYSPSNHTVSDNEIAFKDTLTEISAAPEGQEIVNTVFQTWDQASQGHMWEHPEALKVLTQQKKLGIFDAVVSEVERLRIMGQLPAGISQIQAYQLVGSQLEQQGALNHLIAPVVNVQANQGTPQVQPIATRVATPKPAVTNTKQVAAAAPARTAQVATQNTLSLDSIAKLSDDEFLKLFPKL